MNQLLSRPLLKHRIRNNMATAKPRTPAKIKVEDGRRKLAPRSPIHNLGLGVIFGLFIYMIDRNADNALKSGLAFGLMMNFIDYCMLFYTSKK